VSRPTDWAEVFGIDDPTPGDPFEVRRVASSWSLLAGDAAYAETKVRQLMTDDAVDGWIGEAGEAFRSQSTDLPDQLQKCADSYRLASEALTWWIGQLTTHQADADSALVKGRAAKADLGAAQAHLASTQGSLSTVSAAPALAIAPDLHPPSREQVQAAQQRLQAAQAAQAQASAAVTAAQSRLDAARQLALDAGSLREQDGKTAASRVHEAADAGIKPRHWWQKATDWIADHWDVIIEVARIAVAVLAVVALILGGPLAWVVFGLSVLLLADALNKWREGKASLWDVVLCAIGCIPGARGLTSMSELSAAFRAGGMLGAGSHLLGVGKNAVVGLAAGIRALGPGLRTTFHAVGTGLSIRFDYIAALSRGFRTMTRSDFGWRGSITRLPDLLRVPMPREGMPVYRVHGRPLDAGGNYINKPERADWTMGSSPFGESWSSTHPLSVGDYRSSAGLPDENAARFLTEGALLDSRAVSEIRLAVPLDGNPGGLPEYVISHSRESVSVTEVGGLNEPWTKPPAVGALTRC